MKNKARLIVWSVVGVLIVVMLSVKQFTHVGRVEVQWNEAVAYGAILLIAGGFYELLRWLIRAYRREYRLAFSVGLLGILLLGWVSGAVGIIGSENNSANLLYWAVPAVLLVGSLLARFRPRGMSYTLFATALVQFLVPIFALFIWPAQTSWGAAGVYGVLLFNTIFAGLFLASALLFRRAAPDGIS